MNTKKCRSRKQLSGLRVDIFPVSKHSYLKLFYLVIFAKRELELSVTKQGIGKKEETFSTERHRTLYQDHTSGSTLLCLRSSRVPLYFAYDLFATAYRDFSNRFILLKSLIQVSLHP